MPLQIIRQDITRMDVDAIVTSEGPPEAAWKGGVSYAVRYADGKAEELSPGPGPGVGEAVAERAGRLPAKYVIRTQGPVWRGGTENERELLRSCYLSSLEVARKKRCRSIAFPLISSGLFGYPKDLAVRTAVDAISEFLSENDMDAYLVVFDEESYEISSSLFRDIQSYIDENYEGLPDDEELAGRRALFYALPAPSPAPRVPSAPQIERGRAEESAGSLQAALGNLEETFSQMLLRKIDEKGMRDAQCYRRANVDRRLFSKIRGNKEYQPSKRTVFAFAVALELTLEETDDLLRAAGYAISHSSKFDVIVEYFIQNRNYNVFEINEALFEFDQNLLGA